MINLHREIKFRAWDKEKKQMWYFPLWGMLQAMEEGIGFVKYIQVMQYTGLKDKNGKEIYEGDILLDKEKGQKERAVGFVEYQAYQFVIRKLPKTKRKTWYEMWGCCVGEEGKHLEVIGNIYENPELLK